VVNASVSETAAIDQSKISGLAASLAAKANLSGATFTDNVSVVKDVDGPNTLTLQNTNPSALASNCVTFSNANQRVAQILSTNDRGMLLRTNSPLPIAMQTNKSNTELTLDGLSSQSRLTVATHTGGTGASSLNLSVPNGANGSITQDSAEGMIFRQTSAARGFSFMSNGGNTLFSINPTGSATISGSVSAQNESCTMIIQDDIRLSGGVAENIFNMNKSSRGGFGGPTIPTSGLYIIVVTISSLSDPGSFKFVLKNGSDSLIEVRNTTFSYIAVLAAGATINVTATSMVSDVVSIDGGSTGSHMFITRLS
jgi:hypothetical protein